MAQEGSPDQEAPVAHEAPSDPLTDVSEALLRGVLAQSTSQNGPDDPVTMHITSHLVERLNDSLNFHEALPLAQRGLQYYERLVPEGDPRLSDLLISLARSLKGVGRYEEAERLFCRALNITQRALGHEHPRTLTCCSAVAATWSAMGKHAESEALQRRVLSFHTRILGPTDEVTITTVHGLGRCLLAQPGKLAEGLGMLNEALNPTIQAHGLQHRATIRALLALGTAYARDAHDYPTAERKLRQGLEISQRVLGAEHTLTYVVMEALLGVFGKAGKLQESLPLCRRLLELCGLLKGEHHSETLMCMIALARLLEVLGQHAEAEMRACSALETCTRVLGPDHEHTRKAAEIVADCRRALARGAQPPAGGRARRDGQR